ncbi:polysaccharide deacetylase family protein [Nocardia sp. CDC159]|uniref:Polysaccharide deacetylase family protein n=1 Tax=Nocardia pulmonis TaxID=2951408 RepID=A0A9X2ITU8_9NOCA|nr:MULTISPECIES: polysaccharide deacetylase family protein [Nocardia]MCM6772162.1 polysaccharide deacetylase family protein [Nocardia pulmonis]MCM6785180.1 polysaccharide deacetylase family protein [Nocardia sp. CDC159]
MKRRVALAGAGTLVVLMIVCAGLYMLVNSRGFQLAGRLVSRVDMDEKLVALTIDDGPTERTPQILAALAAQQVPATFYLVGRELDTQPQYGAAIAGAGHELGNHGYTHRRMVLVSTATVREEVERTDAAIARTGYTGPVTFRPPYGKKLYALPSYLSEHGRITVMWDVEPDARGGASADRIVADTLADVRPGSIILLHAMYQSESLAAIPRIVSELRGRGYQFVTVSHLMQH